MVNEYIDELINQFESAVQDTLNETNSNYNRYREYMEKQLRVLDNNRNELHERRNGKRK